MTTGTASNFPKATKWNYTISPNVKNKNVSSEIYTDISKGNVNIA